MALTPEQRKMYLGLGGLSRVARDNGVSEGHVSQINSEKRTEGSQRIRDAITAAIIARHPEVDPAGVWPPLPERSDAETAETRGNGATATDEREHAPTIPTQGDHHVPTPTRPAGTGRRAAGGARR